MNGMVIKQLEKALECKDDKELRLRVEVLLDVLKESGEMRAPIRTQYEQPFKPVPMPTGPKITGKMSNQVRGAGSITSIDSEQITYQRPVGT